MDKEQKKARNSQTQKLVAQWAENQIKDFFVVIGEEAVGPVTRKDLVAKLHRGEITVDDYCCPVGAEEWDTVAKHLQAPRVEVGKLSRVKHTAKIRVF